MSGVSFKVTPCPQYCTVWKDVAICILHLKRRDLCSTHLKVELLHKWLYFSAFYLSLQASGETGIGSKQHGNTLLLCTENVVSENPSFFLSFKQPINYSSLSSLWKFTVPLLLLLMCYFFLLETNKQQISPFSTKIKP